MNLSPSRPNILCSLGLAVAALLPSCVAPAPYVQTQAPPHHVTTYNVGYEVRTLPHGYRTEVIDGGNYYYHNGTYYRPRSGRYVVVEAPRHRELHHTQYGSRHGRVVVTKLPKGYRPIDHRGVRYYQVDNTYYQQRGSGYVVVTRPY